MNPEDRRKCVKLPKLSNWQGLLSSPKDGRKCVTLVSRAQDIDEIDSKMISRKKWIFEKPERSVKLRRIERGFDEKMCVS